METAVGFSSKFDVAVSLAAYAMTMPVATIQEYEAAGQTIAQIRDIEKQLEADYAAHPAIVEAKRLQKMKAGLATQLEEARKSAKAKMFKYDDEQEAARKAEEARRQAEAQAQADAEALKAAEIAEKAGRLDEAQSIIEDAASTPAPVVIVPKDTPKVEGHSRRRLKKFRFTGKPVNSAYLMPDEVKIGQLVRALGKPAESLVGGIEVYEVDA